MAQFVKSFLDIACRFFLFSFFFFFCFFLFLCLGRKENRKEPADNRRGKADK